MKQSAKILFVGVLNIAIILLTILRQIIGYGTTPKIEETDSIRFEFDVKEVIKDYNNEYVIEIAIVGIILVLINFLLLKDTAKPVLKSVLMLIAYLIISIISLMILSERYKDLHFG